MPQWWNANFPEEVILVCLAGISWKGGIIGSTSYTMQSELRNLAQLKQMRLMSGEQKEKKIFWHKNPHPRDTRKTKLMCSKFSEFQNVFVVKNFLL